MEERSYAILMETSADEFESWYYFLKKEGNEESLEHLQKQLEQVEWYIEEGMSTFDLELKHFVSEQTSNDMIRVDLNSCSFHRKFNGVLEKIDFKFKPNDTNLNKIKRVYDLIGEGDIDKYISDEEILS